MKKSLDVEAFAKDLVEQSKTLVENGKQVPNTLIVIHLDGEIVGTMLSCDDDEEWEFVQHATNKFLRKTEEHVFAAVNLAEAFFYVVPKSDELDLDETVAPSKHPEKQEAVIVQIKSRSGPLVYVAPFRRLPTGTVVWEDPYIIPAEKSNLCYSKMFDGIFENVHPQ